MSPLFALPTQATPHARKETYWGHAATTLLALAHRLDGWLALRKKQAADRAELAQMSDRERLDIGLPPQYLRDSTRAWWPGDASK